jgi:Uma2 family endonuclease
MAATPERVILTYEDYCELPDDRQRYELLEGEIDVAPAPNVIHQWIVSRLLHWLTSHVDRFQLGTVLVAPCDVLFSRITVVQPDVLFVARGREHIIKERYIEGAPDLVVEVLSPSTARKDQQVKRQLYARYGVAYYWIFDPERHEARAYALAKATYRQQSVAREAEVFSAPPFPDLRLPLAELWRW